MLVVSVDRVETCRRPTFSSVVHECQHVGVSKKYFFCQVDRVETCWRPTFSSVVHECQHVGVTKNIFFLSSGPRRNMSARQLFHLWCMSVNMYDAKIWLDVVRLKSRTTMIQHGACTPCRTR